ncbi:MAG: hypothetical protein ACRERE_32485, partial [Candidatus Entotheonellia bacterium]
RARLQLLTEPAVAHEAGKMGKRSVKLGDLKSICVAEHAPSKRYAPKHKCFSFHVNGLKMIKTSF